MSDRLANGDAQQVLAIFADKWYPRLKVDWGVARKVHYQLLASPSKRSPFHRTNKIRSVFEEFSVHPRPSE